MTRRWQLRRGDSRGWSVVAPPVAARVVHVFVLGIDPGLSRCGYCVLEGERGRPPRPRALGVLTTPTDLPVPRRLAELRHDITDLLDQFPVEAVAVERVLFQVNVRTAMAVGQASGVIMAEAAARGCEVVEYSPNEVKETVAGDGAADKTQVQTMVQRLLGLATTPRPPDAADAAAVALCHLAHAPLLAARRAREVAS